MGEKLYIIITSALLSRPTDIDWFLKKQSQYQYYSEKKML